jgi:hypothetical protein
MALGCASHQITIAARASTKTAMVIGQIRKFDSGFSLRLMRKSSSAGFCGSINLVAHKKAVFVVRVNYVVPG